MSNRKIRFRAWDARTNTMIYTNSDNTVWVGGIAPSVNIAGLGEQVPGDYTPMQLTGVNDKNNISIYEGDICRIHYYHLPDEPDVIGVVDWIDTGFSIRGIKNLNNDQITSVYSLRFKSGGNYGDYPAVEVIGNIHQHKHLLS